MSLEKAIKHGKEHRKQYYGCRAIDPFCRSHGNCSFCFEGRRHKVLKKWYPSECDEDSRNAFRHLYRNEKSKAMK